MRDGDLAWVEVLLEAWGLWSLRDSARLGYPRQAIFARLMRQGVIGASSKCPRIQGVECSPAVELAEQAIVVMPLTLREAVKTRYLHPHWPSRQCAAHMAMTVPGFNTSLIRAQAWLAGRLSR